SGVSVLLGNGDGTFRHATTYDAGDSGNSLDSFVDVSLVVGDFDGDGKPDIVVTHGINDCVSVLPGNGDGTFQAPVIFDVGRTPLSVSSGDFNGDGKPDLAVVNYLSANVSVLLSSGYHYLPGPADTFLITGFPSMVNVGDPDAFAVTATDSA